MAKKKIVFLSSMAFDANVSIIKRLTKFYDVYYVFSVNEGKSSFGVIKGLKDINRGDRIKELELVRDFIPLEKTFAIKHYPGLTYKKLIIEFKVLKLIREISPDAILTDCANINLWLTRIMYPKICISLIHDPFPHSGENTFARRFANKLLVKYSQRYVLFNFSQKEEFERYYHIEPYKIYCSFLSQYEFITLFKTNKQLLPKEPNKLKVLFYGRISPYKGIKYLYEAVKSYYLKKYDDIHLVIAGKGNLDFDYSGIDEEHLTVYNRYIESDELYSLINWCDIVVCPYTDATQSGVIMSAYALHKPVLATKVGGLPEMLMNGKLGILVPPKDSKALYEALIYIRNNKDCIKAFLEEIDNIYFNNGSRSWNKAVDIISKAIESLVNDVK